MVCPTVPRGDAFTVLSYYFFYNDTFTSVVCSLSSRFSVPCGDAFTVLSHDAFSVLENNCGTFGCHPNSYMYFVV